MKIFSVFLFGFFFIMFLAGLVLAVEAHFSGGENAFSYLMLAAFFIFWAVNSLRYKVGLWYFVSFIAALCVVVFSVALVEFALKGMVISAIFSGAICVFVFYGCFYIFNSGRIQKLT